MEEIDPAVQVVVSQFTEIIINHNLHFFIIVILIGNITQINVCLLTILKK